ncbi:MULTISPECIES: oxygenase MpaB family protein [unclassified Sphingomonas]|uniref:oxygenase MpaB family protein n=1 Tax=unclassified Sphingomonas TaxID=196159 RepID=UPI00226A720C|nr:MULTISPECIES: oxygenase MpaB family protein [unclassified Sphingomonas]
MSLALAGLMRPPAGLALDFSQPPGEPALVGADSISWRVFRNPVSLFVGGVAAVLLELAEPSVCAGVWDHSSFRRDPGLRLRRTGFAAMITVYGPRTAAEAMIARVVRMHGKVSGTDATGQAYHANDPRLLDWVQATASFGFVEAYSRFAEPLSPAEKSTAFAEAAPAALLYGATGAPRSWPEWEALLARTAPTLTGTPVLTDFLDIMTQAPILPAPLRWLQRLLVRAAVEMTPPPVRTLRQLDGRGLRRGEERLVRLLGGAARHLPMGALPPGQAARRVAAR